MLWWIVFVAVLAVPMAYAQVVETAQYTPDEGLVTINTSYDIDQFNVYINYISIQDGNQRIDIVGRDLVSVSERGLVLDLDDDTLDILLSMDRPTLHLEPGAFNSNRGPSVAQEIVLASTIRLGVIPPDDATAAVFGLSASHFNDMLVQQGAPWHLDIIYGDNSDTVESLRLLQQEGAIAVIGDSSILDAKIIVGGDTIVLACCTQDVDGTLLPAYSSMHSLAPDDTHSLSATLNTMVHQGITFIIPVYPDTVQGRLAYDYVTNNSQVSVDTGIRYSSTILPEHIVLHMSDIVRNNIDASIGILLMDVSDSTGILAAAAAEPHLGAARWYGLGNNTDILDNENAAYMANVGHYTIPVHSVTRGALSATIDAILHEEFPHVPHHAYNAYDAIQVLGYAIAGVEQSPYPGYPASGEVLSRTELEPATLSRNLRYVTQEYGGVSGYLGMDEAGALMAPTLDMMEVRGPWWVRSAVYGMPAMEFVGWSMLGDTTTHGNLYSPRQGTVTDTINIGLLVQDGDVSRMRTISHMGIASVMPELADVVPDIITRTGNDTLGILADYYTAGIDTIVQYSTEPQTQAAAIFVNANDMILISPISSSDNLGRAADNIFRLTPPDPALYNVITGTMRDDGILGLLIVHDAGTLDMAEQVALQFGEGAVLTGDIRDANDIVISLNQQYGQEYTGILALGDDIPGMLDFAVPYVDMVSAPWYGVAGALPNTYGITYTMIGQAVSGSPHTQLVMNSISSLHGVVTPQDMATLESVRLAAWALSDDNDSPYLSILRASSQMSPLLLESTRLDVNGDLNDTTHDIWRAEQSAWIHDHTRDADGNIVTSVSVGLAIPVTGEKNGDGHNQLQAAQQASSVYGGSLRLVLADTQGEPRHALSAIETLHERGITTIIGIPDSASLEHISSYVNDNNILVLSCCSDSPELALPDSIYRLQPSFDEQVRALQQAILQDSVSQLVIVHDNDPRDTHLIGAMQDTFDVYDVASTDEQWTINTIEQWERVSRETPAGIILTDTNGARDIMNLASVSPDLAGAKWYGITKDSILPDNVSGSINFVVVYPSQQADIATYGAVILVGAAAEIVNVGTGSILSEIIPAIAGSVDQAPLPLDEFGDIMATEYNILTYVGDRWIVTGIP